MTQPTLHLDASRPADLARARGLLAEGKLVALPTETVYGLAALCHLPVAVARVFEAKERPHFDPLIVHVADAAQAEGEGLVSAWPAGARALIDVYWPGPLTLVVPRGEAVHDLVCAGLPGVALRSPQHPTARALLEGGCRPWVAPSANRFGHISPTQAEHVLADLSGRIDAVLDGGPCPLGIESTVVSFLSGIPEVLRLGPIGMPALARVLPGVRFGQRVLERPLAPGQLARHYAPRTPLRLHTSPETLAPDARSALLVLGEDAPPAAAIFGCVVLLGSEGDAAAAAAQLFATLRTLDGEGHDRLDVLCRGVGPLWDAIRDRLTRAAAD